MSPDSIPCQSTDFRDLSSTEDFASYFFWSLHICRYRHLGGFVASIAEDFDFELRWLQSSFQMCALTVGVVAIECK
jgi:hypothetical protein